MTPEQLRQRRRDRDRNSIMKRMLIDTEEMKRMTDEANAIYEHSRLTQEVDGLEAQFLGVLAASSLLGVSCYAAESAAKLQQAKLRLASHEHQMKYRGFSVPAARK